MTETVGTLGEAGVLDRVLAQYSHGSAVILGPGDDSAVLRFRGDAVVTTDTMIEGNDFRVDWHDAESLGWKLAATNLSDVAAMGATPVALTIAMACPNDTPVALLEGIARGLQRACDVLAPGCAVAGGDLAHAQQLVFAVTAMGDLADVDPVTRSGARVGDKVAYAGELGLSGKGLRALFASPDLAFSQYPREVQSHLRPHPPIHAAIAAGITRATAMMDVSDGLSLDAARLGRASGVTLDFQSALLEKSFGVQDGVSLTVQELMIGGEDHGFLATFPAGLAVPEPFVVIGSVTERSADVLLDGKPFTVAGWDPFANQPE